MAHAVDANSAGNSVIGIFMTLAVPGACSVSPTPTEE
jgi:hypothetical protein